jgi:hypothetical protein
LYFLWPFVIFYGHLVNCMAFGIVCGNLVYFFPFWYVWTEKNLATLGLRSHQAPASNCLRV